MVPKEPGEALNADAITEILLHLPAKSVCRFRCVSKRWSSLISDPPFTRAHAAAAAPAEPTGVYVYDRRRRQAEFYYLNGGGGGYSDPTLSFLDYRGLPPEPVDSCNGLLLCRLPKQFESKQFVLSVCNPTSREHEVIPLSRDIPREIVEASLHLAFDPRRSPHYMIIAAVCAVGIEGRLTYKYTSETRSWGLIDWPTSDRHGNWFHIVVYWKGSLVSANDLEMLVALDVESEQMHEILLPPARPRDLFFNLAATGDRLHYMRGESSIRFVIWEMASVSSGWHVLHSVDLDSVKYPCLRSLFTLVAAFIRGDEDRLLIQVRSKIVSFNLRQKILTMICHVPGGYDYKILPLAHSLSPLIANRIDAPPSQEWVSWKSEHDQLLISLMVEQSNNGKKMENGFQTDAWREMVRMFNQATGMNYDVHHLENRLESYKREYQTVRKILSIDGFHWHHSEKMVKASNTGWRKILMHLKNFTPTCVTCFHWHHSEKMVKASNTGWRKILKVHKNPQARVYKRKQVPFEDLKIICASSIRINSNVSQNTCCRKRKGRHD